MIVHKAYFGEAFASLTITEHEANVRNLVGVASNLTVIRVARQLGEDRFVDVPEARTSNGSLADILWQDEQRRPRGRRAEAADRARAEVPEPRPRPRTAPRASHARIAAAAAAAAAVSDQTTTKTTENDEEDEDDDRAHDGRDDDDDDDEQGQLKWRSAHAVLPNTWFEYRKRPLEQLLGYIVRVGLRYGYVGTGEFTRFVRHDGDGAISISRPFSGSAEGEDYATASARADSKKLSVNQAMFALLHHARTTAASSTGVFPRENGAFAKIMKEAWGATKPRSRPVRSIQRAAMLAGGVVAPPDPPRDEALRSVFPIRDEEDFTIPLPWTDNCTVVTESEAAVTTRCSSDDLLPEYYVKTRTLGNNEENNELARAEFENEAEMYMGPLRPLQGTVCPFLIYGGDFKGRFIIATTPCGRSLSYEDLWRTSSDDDKGCLTSGSNNDDEKAAPVAAAALTALPTLRDRMRAALQAVHDAGVLHGNVTPRNFALDEASGRVPVIDFGRARAVDDLGKSARQAQGRDGAARSGPGR